MRAWPEAIFCSAEKAARRLRLILQGTPELLSGPKLHGLVRAIWYMAYNGQPHDIKRDNYGYAERLAQITKDSETCSGSCRNAGIAYSLRVFARQDQLAAGGDPD